MATYPPSVCVAVVPVPLGKVKAKVAVAEVRSMPSTYHQKGNARIRYAMTRSSTVSASEWPVHGTTAKPP